MQGQIFINGVPIEENQNWYVSNTGYVIQLARPYYDELTVRENLTLAAWIRLPATAREKFQRVEQVMDVVRRERRRKGEREEGRKGGREGGRERRVREREREGGREEGKVAQNVKVSSFEGVL